jgi:aminoacylase
LPCPAEYEKYIVADAADGNNSISRDLWNNSACLKQNLIIYNKIVISTFSSEILIFFALSCIRMEHIGVTKFREYLRINTMQPNPDYSKCAGFLKNYAAELGLDYKQIEFVCGKPIVILSWKGTNPQSKSIILNSHTDVVPVDRQFWDFDPFEAHKKPNGDIVARGSQDMKCVGIWYLEAIRKLKETKVNLKKTVHLTFVPDEEIGGADGMSLFVKSKEFKELNPGFALDEGLANNEDAFKVYYGERSPWWLTLTAKGGAGHASKFIEPCATEKLLAVLRKFSNFRGNPKFNSRLGKTKIGIWPKRSW